MFRAESVVFIEDLIKELPFNDLLLVALRSMTSQEIVVTINKVIKEKDSLISIFWNLFLAIMILYFILSTVESLALGHMQATGYKFPSSETNSNSNSGISLSTMVSSHTNNSGASLKSLATGSSSKSSSLPISLVTESNIQNNTESESKDDLPQTIPKHDQLKRTSSKKKRKNGKNYQ
jgi:hypothetical protein